MAAKEASAPATASVQDQVREALRRMSPDELRAMAGRATTEDRRARYEAERAERLKRVVLVRFEKSYLNYNAGEIAGLPPKDAHAAIADGFATRVGGSQPIAEPARANEQARETERAQVEHVAKFIGALDEADEGHFDANGLPSLTKLSQLAGFSVTAQQRDAAWKKFQADQDTRGR
jgi:hypothetical protein